MYMEYGDQIVVYGNDVRRRLLIPNSLHEAAATVNCLSFAKPVYNPFK